MFCCIIVFTLILGSHDSMTNDINCNSEVSPDAEDIIKSLTWLGPLLRGVMKGWARTQEFNVTEQLKAGIRYFDLRIATKKNTDMLFIVHGQYGGEIQKILNDTFKWLEEHPQEVCEKDSGHLSFVFFVFFFMLIVKLW